MKCIKCNKEHDGSFGSGKYCSRACANSRVRTDDVKQKIRDGVVKNAHWLDSEWREKVKKANQSIEKASKIKKTWESKRDYKNAHIWSIKKWLKEERGNKCEECGITEWQGKPISMEVDHIDGNKTNNDLSNLKVLCPNCHSQTPTWRRKKQRVG